MGQLNLGTVYDFNKIMLEQAGKPKTNKELTNIMQDIVLPYFTEKTDSYFMLLCREDNNYTVIHFNARNYSQLMTELLITLKNRGQVYDIVRTEDGVALEIWVKDEELKCYYLFPCTECIIEIGGTND